MYEQGWGKSLNYCIGASCDSVIDVTRRYTRKFHTDDFQSRRREYAPDEISSHRAFVQMDNTLRQMNTTIVKGRLDELDKRCKAEAKFFDLVQSSGVWDVEYREGRVSGSLAWKAARQELGNKTSGNDNKEGCVDNDTPELTHSFFVESFYPSYSDERSNVVEIVVRPPKAPSVPSTAPKSYPECITVSGVSCAAATMTHGFSIVVVDEVSGCILQSKAFSQLSSMGAFIDTVPDGRVVALCCIIKGDQQTKSVTSSPNNFRRLGGFNMDNTSTSTNESFYLYSGQLNFHPEWAIGVCTSDSTQSITVSLQMNSSSVQIKTRLRSQIDTVPACIVTRLPESIMPHKTQIVATNYQKRVAFNSYMANDDVRNKSIIGYSTRQNAPIYLIDNKSFPFQRSGDNVVGAADTSWMTYHYLPDPLVSDDDELMDESTNKIGYATPKFDIPIATDYFTGILGTQLLVKNASSSTTPFLMDTSSALANSRLVALYFSASWCGPCRGFTPLLIEFYTYLQEVVAPTHGIKIVFVSSDQDESQFHAYYSKMPFLALPYTNRDLAQQTKSVFGVRGIPSLVVLDSLSGTIVTSPDESRRDVHQACQRGDDAIARLFHDWLDKVSFETKSMLDILALSIETSSGAEKDKSSAGNAKSDRYLIRNTTHQEDKKAPVMFDFAARVKEIFPVLVAMGMEPNAAAAKAIEQVTTEQTKSTKTIAKLDVGTLLGTSEICNVIDAFSNVPELLINDTDNMRIVLNVAKKYVTNVLKDPTIPRFRNIKLSNKVFDQITSISGGIELLTNLGFAVYHTDEDFVASIPLYIDLTTMCSVFDNLI
jgi:nucleoredoxin